MSKKMTVSTLFQDKVFASKAVRDEGKKLLSESAQVARDAIDASMTLLEQRGLANPDGFPADNIVLLTANLLGSVAAQNELQGRSSVMLKIFGNECRRDLAAIVETAAYLGIAFAIENNLTK
jgi:hypothetical protein